VPERPVATGPGHLPQGGGRGLPGGALDNSQGNNFTQNATQRCNAQPASDREACLQRILGAGSAQGSVNGGGILRETETKVK
jgi:hypothetical protein